VYVGISIEIGLIDGGNMLNAISYISGVDKFIAL